MEYVYIQWVHVFCVCVCVNMQIYTMMYTHSHFEEAVITRVQYNMCLHYCILQESCWIQLETLKGARIKRA